MSDKEIITNPQGRFGTIEGVFTPCVLTILGVIMFMRSGFVIGHSGLWLGLVILGISKLITTLTTLSLSAISTNTKVSGGGVYFMISRSLGPDFGGTIGLTLFIAQAVGVSFYIIGFSEAFIGAFVQFFSFVIDDPQSFTVILSTYKMPQILSSFVVMGLFYLTFKGAEVAMKVQNYVLIILLVSIASFLVGGIMDFNSDVFEASKTADFSNGIGFWTAFAIFFPAATGITAGANMSGDLKNPERAIPKGTLLAILFTIIIYVAQFVLMAGSTSREVLKSTPYEALQNLSFFSPLVVLGVFAATLSSALGSFLGAPRILQAMGRDGLMKSLVFFAKGQGESDEPQRATILTFIIAFLVIWAGDLNAVAEVISMFFLIAYGTINLSAFVESKGGNPSFRPQFKFFHWTTALAGAIGCGAVMMKINDTYALIALVVSAAIYIYLKKQSIKTNFGDAKRGYIFSGISDSLTLLEGTKAHPKNWRPVLVAITNDSKKESSLIRTGSWLEGGRGMYTVANILEDSQNSYDQRIDIRNQQLESLEQIKNNQNLIVFLESLVTKNYHEGLFNFLQCHSLGVLKPNSILIGMPSKDNAQDWSQFMKSVEIVASFNQNLVIHKPKEIIFSKKSKIIDIWWGGKDNGSLMVLFAYIMSLSSDWRGVKIRLLRVLRPEEDEATVYSDMTELTRLARIEAMVKVVPKTNDYQEAIRKVSGIEADMVLLGMNAKNGEEAKQSIELALPLLNDLPSTLLVWSNGEANVFA